MSDELLTSTDQEEALSRVYAHAVAARAGYDTSTQQFDRDGVDLRIHAGGAMRPALDFQLKATTSLVEPQNGYITFPLKRRNYDLLIEETQTPRLLLLLDLPNEADEWMTITNDNVILRRRAYWLNLKGEPETTNIASVTVRIPISNRFDVESLRGLMHQSRYGRLH